MGTIFEEGGYFTAENAEIAEVWYFLGALGERCGSQVAWRFVSC